MDAEERPDMLLDFLDDYAALDAVREHKLRATDALGLTPGRCVLDVGCGTGADLLAMLERVRPDGSVTGIDVSLRALERARARVAGEVGAAVEIADVQALPFPDGAFDACRADRALQHVPDADRALRELQRVLRAGGTLAVLEVASEVEGPPAFEEHPVTRMLRERAANTDERRAWLPLMLPLLLTRAGFGDVRADVAVTRTGETRAAQVVLHAHDSVAEAVQAGALTPESFDDWSARLDEAAGSGALSVTLRGALFVARAAG